MPSLVELTTRTDERGSLTVFDDLLPFAVKRTFFLHDIAKNQTRGGHGHFHTQIALICVQGYCNVYTNNGKVKESFKLDSISKVLILKPEDWHLLQDFSSNAIVIALASHGYDSKDYFYEEP